MFWTARALRQQITPMTRSGALCHVSATAAAHGLLLLPAVHAAAAAEHPCSATNGVIHALPASLWLLCMTDRCNSQPASQHSWLGDTKRCCASLPSFPTQCTCVGSPTGPAHPRATGSGPTGASPSASRRHRVAAIAASSRHIRPRPRHQQPSRWANFHGAAPA